MRAPAVAADVSLSVADRLALSDLVHRYAASVDDRHFDAVAKLFTEDAEWAVPDPPTTPASHTDASLAWHATGPGMTTRPVTWPGTFGTGTNTD